VTPRTGSRLWTVGASAGIAILALIGAAVLEPANAVWLLGAAVLVGLSSWTLNRSPSSAAGPAPTPETPAPDLDATLGLMNRLLEARGSDLRYAETQDGNVVLAPRESLIAADADGVLDLVDPAKRWADEQAAAAVEE